MKNYGKKVMCLIFVTVVVFWTGFTLPRWLRDVPTGQVEIGKSGAEREPDEFMDMGAGKAQEYEQQVYGSVRQVLERRSVDGFSGEAQTVLEKVYDTLDEIITPGMTDQDKVRAIHDYLILHADYYEGDLGTRPGWSSAAEGVLMRGSGVCNSYALAFYAMCTAESVECHIVSGWATSTMGRGDHAWNRVKLGDTWYYIDCTWDDPTGGGMENYLKLVYAAPTEETALNELELFKDKWDSKYPKIYKSWHDNWATLSAYFKYPEAVRRLIYTTNAIEGFNRQLRKVTKSKTVFPSDDSLLKMPYLATMDITKKWTGHRQDWGQIYSQLEIYFEERLIGRNL